MTREATAMAVLGGIAAAAAYVALLPDETPEHELVRVRQARNGDPERAAKEHVLGVDDAGGVRTIDAGGAPLVLWLKLPGGRRWYARRTGGTGNAARVAYHERAGATWIAFEVSRAGDLRLEASAGRVTKRFDVKIRDVGLPVRERGGELW